MKTPALVSPGLCVIAQFRCNLLLHLNFQRFMLEVVAGAGSNLHLLPEQVKMVAGAGFDYGLQVLSLGIASSNMRV